MAHDVAFDDGPASLKLRTGTWGRTFEEPGTYDYLCTLHPNMTGTVTVG
jgi:plastocyanin